MPAGALNAGRGASWLRWVWMAGGFFAVLFIYFVFSSLLKNSPPVPPVAPAWPGQWVTPYTPGGSGQKFRWVEFKGDDLDPSKWYHVIEERQAGGAFVRKTISHSEFMKTAGNHTLDFLPPNELQGKP